MIPVVGELDICELCDSSPHLRGCPHHAEFDSDGRLYANVEAPGDVGSAAYWVGDTFQQAAMDCGESEDSALREGIQEFEAALSRGDVRPV